MRVRRCEGAGEFLERAGAWLAEREAEHNLILGVAGRLRDAAPRPVYFAAVEDASGAVVGAAMRTPPYQLALSAMDEAAAVAVARDVRESYATIPGVLGPPVAARAAVEEWTRLTGQPGRLGRRQRVFQIERVEDVARAGGRLRVAAASDRDRMIEWMNAFSQEAIPGEPADDTPEMVDRRIAVGQLVIWETVPGTAVSFAGFGGPTAHGIRIGPVYTPPALRAHGYATALVADLSQRLLAEGRQFCFLYTDLANATSNRIYERIGYTPVADADQWFVGGEVAG